MSIDAVNLIRRLHQHRMWVNANVMAAAAALSEEQLRRSFEIGQGSIWKSLTHLYGGDFVWLAALEGTEEAVAPGDVRGKLPGNQMGEGALTSLAELKTRWAEVSERWNRYLEQLRPESLDEIVYRVSTSSGFGKRWGTRRYDVLLHVCTHAQYTIAQVMNMLRHCGAGKLPEVMLITLARQETGEAPKR
jgi:uncharacterized damage-inducible protein DinB